MCVHYKNIFIKLLFFFILLFIIGLPINNSYEFYIILFFIPIIIFSKIFLKKRHKIKSEGLTEEYIDKYNLAKQKSTRIQMATQRLAIVRKPSPPAFKLPEYTELDYEAWHDKVHDTEWRLEDAYDAGISSRSSTATMQ